jgi:histidinol-phosphate phosphatase family protein
MNSSVAILAGGKGTRIKSRAMNIPKPMIKVCGIPILEHQILLCKEFEFTNIVLLVEHQNEIIKDYFLDGKKFGVSINYVVESEPRGTAGALFDAIEYMLDDFLVLYGDTYADIDLRSFYQKHMSTKVDATIFLHPNDHPFDSDLVEIDDNNKVIKIHPYPHLNEYNPNLVNAGLYALKKTSFINCVTSKINQDLAKDSFPVMISSGMHIYGYVSPEYIKDMGTPERLDKVQADILSGRTKRLSNRSKRQVVFIDRDGTINQEVSYITSPDQLKLIPGAASAIKKLNSEGILTLCITNQPVIARGELTYTGLKKIHSKLDFLLGEQKAYLDRYYVCPHHPDSGFIGERAELKIKCSCRKPGTALIEKAIDELNIDKNCSWIIGDSTSDILAGKQSGLRTILVTTGYAGQDKKNIVQPDYIFGDISEAVDWIINEREKIVVQLKDIINKIINCKFILVGGLARSGKSSVARVVADMLKIRNQSSHVISLDGWLKPKSERIEGGGIINRYDIKKFLEDIFVVLNSVEKINFRVPIYNRVKSIANEYEDIEINAHDSIIVEGVPALLDQTLLKLSAFQIYVETNYVNRINRLTRDYKMRGLSQGEIDKIIKSRDLDEVPEVISSSIFAQLRVIT